MCCVNSQDDATGRKAGIGAFTASEMTLQATKRFETLILLLNRVWNFYEIVKSSLQIFHTVFNFKIAYV